MHRSHALVVLALVAVVFTAHPSAQHPASPQFVAGQILVKFRPGAAAAVQADVHRQAGGTRLAETPRTRVQLVAVPAGDERGAINRYLRNPNVEIAEPNFIRSVGTPPVPPSVTDLIPGDSSFSQQWALHNTGQMFYCIPWIDGTQLCFYVGTPDADIDAPEAWALSTGSAVKVAVIDTGIDYTHPDLAARYAGGYDFLNGDADPFDDHGHGTHVSGTIAAEMNNATGEPPAAEGVVGIAPNARILAYKVCGPDGHCSDFAITQAIDQAITDGAKVINMSLGGADYSQSLNDSIQAAWAAGLVIVAGAGNDGNTNLFYPAAFENVVSVGATDEDDLRASFSNYGSWVDIAAPGNVILSTYLMSGCSVSTTPGDIGCYAFNTGTSMATPHVSGAAALVWSRSDITSNWQVVDALTHGADASGVSAVPINTWTVYGRLNLYGAMTYAAGPPPPPNNQPVASAGTDVTVTDGDGDGGVMITLNGSGSSDPDGDPLTYQWREGATIIGSGPSPNVFFVVGVHTVTLEVTDGRGGSSTDTVVITVNAPPPPNTSPIANAGSDTTVTDSNGDGGETVSLNGTGSSDPDGDALTYQWRDGTTIIGAGPTPSVSLLVGVHTITLEVQDGHGGSSTDTVVVTVNAPPPPPATLAVTAISPNVVNQKAGAVTFVITGTAFAIGANVSFLNGSGPAPRVLSVTRDSSTQLTARVEIRSGGGKTTRRWDVVVTNPDGTSAVGTGLLTITP